MEATKKGKRTLNKTDVFVLGFGAMIGWGWVVLSGEWIKTAGTLGAVLAFVLGGILVLLIGFVYSELTAALPQNGGVMLFCLRGLGSNCAFICTWAMILGYISVIAFEVVALPTVLQHIFPGLGGTFLYSVAGSDVNATWLIIGLAASVLIAFINILGTKKAAGLQKLFTFFMIAVGIALLAGALLTGSLNNTKPLFVDSYKGIAAVSIMTPFLYVGIDVIPQSAEEMNIPFKKIGRIILLSVMVAVLWYVTVIVSVSLTLGGDEIASSNGLVTADAMQKAFGGSGLAAKILIAGGLAGIISSWNAFYIGASRAVCAMAERGMLPKALADVHPKYGTPYKAIGLICAVTSLAAFFGRNMTVWVSNAGGFAVVVTYIMVSMAFFALRKKEPDLKRPFNVKHWRALFAITMLLCLLMLLMYLPFAPSSLNNIEWGIVGIWSVVGAVFWVVAKRSDKRSGNTLQ